MLGLAAAAVAVIAMLPGRDPGLPRIQSGANSPPPPWPGHWPTSATAGAMPGRTAPPSSATSSPACPSATRPSASACRPRRHWRNGPPWR
ncbi:hypothetical protein ACFQU7_20430 [Pseudoroseomonas wenyumeiae]